MTCSFWSLEWHHSLLPFLPGYLLPISCDWCGTWCFFHTEPCTISWRSCVHATGWKLYPHNTPRKGGRIRYFHSASSLRSLIDFSIVHFNDMFFSRAALHGLLLVENKWWNKWCVRCWDLLLDLSQVQYCECHLKPKYDTTEACERVILSITRFTCAQGCFWELRQTNNWSRSLLRRPFNLLYWSCLQTLCLEWSLMATRWLGNVHVSWSAWAGSVPDML